MRRHTAGTIILGLFALALGHMAWVTLFAPTAPFTAEISGVLPALVHPDADARQLYLRRTIHVTQRPRCAWIRVVGHDRVRLVVNGRLVESQMLDGFDVAITADLAPYLEIGKNVIAIHVKQTRIRGRPAVAVEGSYTLSDGDHAFSATDAEWYCGRSFERHADWWYGHDFDERLWPAPIVESRTFHAVPPRIPESVTKPGAGRWVSHPSGATGETAFRHAFEIEGRPASAWLRVTATGPYRLAVNGTVVDQQSAGAGLEMPMPPMRRLYDITSHVSMGSNVVSLLLGSNAGEPRLQVDGGVTDGTKPLAEIASNSDWDCCRNAGADWLATTGEPAKGWQPCLANSGDSGIPPWGPARQDITVETPWQTSVLHGFGELVLMGVLGFFGWFGSRAMAKQIGPGTAYLALLPAAILAGAMILASYDPRYARQDIYRPLWLALLLFSVPLQWILLERMRNATLPPPAGWLTRRNATLGLLAAALLTGFWLRARDMTSEPLQWDEVENYNVTIATLKYGFPMLEVHTDLPRLVIHTSEFQFVFHAAVAAVVGDPQWVVRLPAVLFSTATILLVFVVGRRMFGLPTALAAAWLYALSSGYAPMATVGRYFSQLQFFTLLTVYLAWRLAERPEPLNGRLLWAAAASFLGMFFTWEGSALVAPAIAAAFVFAYRGPLRVVLLDRRLWAVVGVIVLAYMLQRANHSFAQTRFLWIGISLSDIRLLPMWNHQSFLPWYYLWESSWSQDTLFPLVGLGAGLLAAAGPGGRPFRFLLWIYLTTCLAMAFLLPNYQFRYIYHVSPMLLLLATGTLGRAATALARSTPPGIPHARPFARMIATGTVVAAVALACGQFLDTRSLTRLRVDGMSTGLFKYPDLGGPARFVRDHMQPGDVILSNNSFQTNHLMGILGQPSHAGNYIPMTGRLFLPATFPDHTAILIDRRDGAKVIASPDDFKEVVARHPRVWYIAQPGQHYSQNTPTMSDYLVQHFEVLYEDYDSLVLFHGASNTPAAMRQKAHKQLAESGAKILD